MKTRTSLGMTKKSMKSKTLATMRDLALISITGLTADPEEPPMFLPPIGICRNGMANTISI